MVLQEIKEVLLSVTSKEDDEIVEQVILVIVEEEVKIAMQYLKQRRLSVNYKLWMFQQNWIVGESIGRE